MPDEKKKPPPNLKLEIIEKLSGLMAGGFGLVAALAWNDAIQSLFRTVFGTASNLLAKFLYAILITLLVVFITVRIGRVAADLKDRMDRESNKSS
jgi:hypothetical protein